MKITMLYRPASEGAGAAEDYAGEYSRRHPDKRIELIDVDSPKGDEMAKLYDLTRYPAILALAEDGALLQLWQDEHLPLMNELDFYQQSN